MYERLTYSQITKNAKKSSRSILRNETIIQTSIKATVYTQIVHYKHSGDKPMEATRNRIDYSNNSKKQRRKTNSKMLVKDKTTHQEKPNKSQVSDIQMAKVRITTDKKCPSIVPIRIHKATQTHNGTTICKAN